MTLLLAVALAVLVGALAHVVSGIGFVLVSGPLLVTALGPADGVRLGVVLSLVLNAAMLVRHRSEVDLRRALLLLVPAVVATPLVALAVRDLPERGAAALAGAAAVLGASALALGLRWPAARGTSGAVAAGTTSAAMNVVAAIGGPAVALYAVNAGWPAGAVRSTLQLYFLGLNLVALATLGPPAVPGDLLLAACLALAAGLAAGVPLARRLAEAAARRAMLALAGLGGGVVLLQAATG